MEGITTYQGHSRIKDLRHSGRDTNSVSESDAADLHSFGRPIGAKPAVPPEDQVHRLPSTPPRHG